MDAVGWGWAVGACNVSATRCGRAFGMRQGLRASAAQRHVREQMQSAHWALFNVSADQHVLRCVRVTDAADTIVEICVVSGRGTSSIYLLLGTGRIVMRAHPASTPRARHTTTRPSINRRASTDRTGEGDAV